MTIKKRIKTRLTPSTGANLVEFALISVLLLFFLFSIIDLARYFYAHSVAQNALAYAIKRSQSEFNTVTEFDTISSTSPQYQAFKSARESVIGEATQLLQPVQNMLRFYPTRGLDDLADGPQQAAAQNVAYLLPGTAHLMFDPDAPDASPEVIHNNNICWKRAGRPLEQNGVEFYPADQNSCPTGIYRETESYTWLTKHYPLELAAKAKFNGILFKNLSITVRAAGYLPFETDGPSDYSERTPTPTSTVTPTITPTESPISTPAVTGTSTNHSTVTATPAGSASPLISGTPTATQTQAATPTIIFIPSVTPSISATPEIVPTSTPTTYSSPTPTPSNTPASDGCPTYFTVRDGRDAHALLGKDWYARIPCSTFSDSNQQSNCTRFDLDLDGVLSASDVFKIIYSCQGTPTPTPTPTITPTLTPTISQTFDPNCNLYVVQTNSVQVSLWGSNYGPDKVSNGPGSSLSCVRDMVKNCTLVRASNLSRILHVSDGFCDDDIYWWFQRNIMNSSSSYIGFTHIAFMDRNCRPVPAPDNYHKDVCGTLDIRMAASPISLIWDTSAPELEETTLTDFPLSPNPEHHWHIWKASAKSPLLVYDPERTGEITSASQLFGHSTFGGKRLASASSKVPSAVNIQSSYWKNGYEALAELDLNGDSQLSGEELTPLSLWFDNNQDGISQPGEVHPVQDEQVQKIYVKPDSSDPITGNVRASIGYERKALDGTLVSGASVDWFAEGFNSKAEALLKLQKRGSLYKEKKPQSQEVTSPSGAENPTRHNPDPTVLRENTLVGGAWAWHIDESSIQTTSPQNLLPKGVLTFSEHAAKSDKPDEREITGHSWIENDLRNAVGNASKMMAQIPLTGRVFKEKGKTFIEFTLKTDDGASIKSRGELSADGLSIIGLTQHHFPGKQGTKEALKFFHKWDARRI